ncbi:hypothetical protein, partial [Nocardia sp. NPDC058497]|uniref:hypothetical protein n=1 Tax=Nocardia sp. NPDC058497 TaxID=3346529 RepID=UPI003666181E
IAVGDAPAPTPPDYLGDPVKRGRIDATPEQIATLDPLARKRNDAIARDTTALANRDNARTAFEADPSPANQARLDRAEAEYSSAHTAMSKAAEKYGDNVAAEAAIRDHYPGATRIDLHGPANGNHQFDQVWRTQDGRYVVVEAKSSTETRLGARNLPNGQRVSQGTRDYFEDILNEMENRGMKAENQRDTIDGKDLVTELRDSLEQDNLDYVVVHGAPNTGTYAGYKMKTFNIEAGS